MHANTHNNGGFTYAIETLLAIAFQSSHVTAFKYRLTVNHPDFKQRLMSHVIIYYILLYTTKTINERIFFKKKLSMHGKHWVFLHTRDFALHFFSFCEATLLQR